LSITKVLTKLKTCIDSRVKLTFRDGEIVTGDLDVVLEDENVVVFDLVTSNRPDKYERSDKRPHISATISDVTECERVSESGGLTEFFAVQFSPRSYSPIRIARQKRWGRNV
jgi:small nuclear ribonucleoprotein (snRNP)-like protein